MGIRVISGMLRGKKLQTMPGTATRPTADKVRESIFNILYHKVQNAYILDLFAGTGAFGIESLSRGAAHCTFIDNNYSAVNIITQNIKACRLSDQSRIIRWDLSKNLNCPAMASDKYDLVFMDPPYHQNLIDNTLLGLAQCPCLNPGATIIAEHGIEDDLLEKTDPFVKFDQRRYGKTLVSFFSYMV